MKVKDGDMVEVEQPLIEGSINPGELLEIKGPEGVFEYLISEVQKVYRNQGVDINDKHVEVIARQMLKKVRVEDNADTDMFPGALIDMYEFADKNREAVENGKRPATGKRVLLGITKASLATDSFLSAASFQETTRVLTEAAVKGKTDDLVGLKENVIIGKLIPAGTGMQKYQNIHINTEKELEQIANMEEAVKPTSGITTEGVAANVEAQNTETNTDSVNEEAKANSDVVVSDEATENKTEE